ncbi:zinc-finger homeodomain protein 9-like isoform X2 [Cynara cardunculus var. scolymus]|uniref:zinc-finger homeodomain protein 9-like isoform X2 n=1 Tax=Cynara cardunculus var. scolymus TaxID=59895 RepID=UPI000D62E63A|nr:zinc-finger homeodomain protein 9-like isoform X2 [Cynara cardunculus var. scolymus]
MEIPPSSPPPTTTTTTTNTTTAIKTLDPDTRIQPNTIPKHLPPPFSNGVLKRHKPRHLHHINPMPVVITYRECLKNHAAAMGGHAVDGCGEFMPSSTSTPTDPTSLKCAACGCHRNFHRRDPDETFPNNPPTQHVIEYQPHHRHHPPPPPPQPISLAGARGNSSSPPDSPSPPPISSSYYPSAPHMLLALSAGLSAPPPENMNNPSIPITPGSAPGIGSHPNGKKRFRTKFTQDQKDKMQELAERVGWKMQKRDEDLIIGFCNEIGVEKGVFKVWMHNNKMNLGSKKDSGNQNDNGSYGGAGAGAGGIDFLSNRDNNDNHHHHHHHQQQPHNDSISSGGDSVHR